MDAEIKQVLLSWNEKGRPYGNIMYIYDIMMVTDEALVKCEEILEETGLGIGYTSRKSEADRVLEGKRTLNYYIDALSAYADTALDQPLKKDFRENATETISRIHLEDFSVDNTVGLTQNTYINGGMYSPGTTLEQKKGKLTFADFIGTSDGKGSGNGFSMSFPNGCVEGFAEIFAGQYQALKASQMLGEDSELTQQEFLEQFYRQGEFTHDAGNPFLNFVSSVLDITIIKPVIEACTGEDLITGEDLSDLERGLKVVFAVVDLATLGGALAATKLSEAGAKEGLKVLGKTVAIDFAGNAAACGVGALGEAFDWPVPVTIMLSLAAGLTVSIAGNKLLIKNAEGVVIGEKVLDDGEIKRLEKVLDETSNSSFARKNLDAVLKNQGITLEEFNSLRLKDVSTLTDTEKVTMKAIRESVPMPDANTLMQKVIPASDIEKYIDGSYTGVKGFVTKLDDVIQLSTYDDFYNSLRLDYPNSPYDTTSDGFVGVIRYTTDETFKITIPYSAEMGGSTIGAPPFTGNGFTKATNGAVIPEYECSAMVTLSDGAKLFEISSEGTETLKAVYSAVEGRFIPVE